MKQLASIATCLVLFVAAPVLASDSKPHSGISSAIVSSQTLSGAPDIRPNETNAIADHESATLLGAGWKSDFWCGAAAGAGLVLSATGVLTPVGVGLSAAGIYCALYM